MLRKLFVVTGFAVAFLLFGCASPYAPAPQTMPQHIKKLTVRPFVNNTATSGLEEKLTLAVVNEFVRDGRFAVANNEADADGVVVGEIKRYILQPLTYDQNLITTQYKLWVVLNLYFIDKANNVTLWTEPNMEGMQVYYDANQPGGRTEDEVRDILWDSLSRDIVKRTIEGFGSVQGGSEKKIPGQQ